MTALGPFIWEFYFLLLISWSSPLLIETISKDVCSATLAGMACPGKRAEINPQRAQGWDGVDRGLKQELPRACIWERKISELNRDFFKDLNPQTAWLVFQRRDSGGQDSGDYPVESETFVFASS